MWELLEAYLELRLHKSPKVWMMESLLWVGKMKSRVDVASMMSLSQQEVEK